MPAAVYCLFLSDQMLLTETPMTDELADTSLALALVLY